MTTHGYQWRKRPPGEVHKVIAGRMHRCCPDCLRWLPATTEHYYAAVAAKDGLQVRCKKCHYKRCHPAIDRYRARQRLAERPPMILPYVAPEPRVSSERPFEIEHSLPIFAQHSFPSLAEICMPTGAEYDARKAA
jgi:hypothetical protein